MEQCVDVSQLEAPEPMERILDALADLPPGDWLKVMHRREPFPLYNILKTMGYRWSVREGETTELDIFIWPEDQAPPPGAESA